ncbi:hypothetical protein CMV_020195 [Castanea mollissima]|uniref:Uncharacterized protein n=1 Tax=Castanea mollissima TaxID=60419 RepID=A0A8J4QM44_9ROSI|nr:hypothetical protein CMV_020195 [Castanea mollissima]
MSFSSNCSVERWMSSTVPDVDGGFEPEMESTLRRRAIEAKKTQLLNLLQVVCQLSLCSKLVLQIPDWVLVLIIVGQDVEVEDEYVDGVVVGGGVLVAVEDDLEASDVLRGGEDRGFCTMSTRLLERRSKRRRVPKSEVMIHHETYSTRDVDVKTKIREGFDPNDPLRLSLWGPETKQLLTVDEESKLIAQVQDLLKLEEVKSRLQSHFGR